MKFIDRQKELNRLETAIRGCKGKLLVVYGRRRLGKSTHNRICIHLGTEVPHRFLSRSSNPALILL